MTCLQPELAVGQLLVRVKAAGAVRTTQRRYCGTDRVCSVGAHPDFVDDEFHPAATTDKHGGCGRILALRSTHRRVSGGGVERNHCCGECVLPRADSAREGTFHRLKLKPDSVYLPSSLNFNVPDPAGLPSSNIVRPRIQIAFSRPARL